MCSANFQVGLMLSLLCLTCEAATLPEAENMCVELGFQKKTEPYGECVLELKRRGGTKAPAGSISSSSNDMCSDFGFSPGTAAYSECQLKMEIAKRDAQLKQASYALQLKQYEEEKARYEKEKQRQQDDAMLRFGLSLMGGTSPHFSENLANAGRASMGLPPIAPSQPQIQNFTITTPYGRTTNCSVVNNFIKCF